MRRWTGLLALCFLMFAAGCDVADPIALQVQFEPEYMPLEGGVCDVEIVALAIGIGTATWERVVVSRGGELVNEYVGPAVADFWGATQIQAGEAQRSIPVRMTTATPDLAITVFLRIGGPERIHDIVPDCREQ